MKKNVGVIACRILSIFTLIQAIGRFQLAFL